MKRYFEVSKQIVPFRWQGERDCIVGPFSSRDIALYFTEHVMVDAHVSASNEDVFAHRDGWYIAVALSNIPYKKHLVMTV